MPPTPGWRTVAGSQAAIARAGGPEIQDGPVTQGGPDRALARRCRRVPGVMPSKWVIPRSDDGARGPDLGRGHPRGDGRTLDEADRWVHGRWAWSPSAPAWGDSRSTTPRGSRSRRSAGTWRRERVGACRVRRGRRAGPGRLRVGRDLLREGLSTPRRRRSDQWGIRRTWRAKFSAWMRRIASERVRASVASQAPLPGPEYPAAPPSADSVRATSSTPRAASRFGRGRRPDPARW